MEDRQRYKTPPSKTDGGNRNRNRNRNRNLDSYQQLLGGTLRLLAIRPRSSSEIIKYLQKKTSDSFVIEKVVDQLIALKYIDDNKFASWVVESYSRSRPKGKSLLVQILKQKGVSPDTINKVMPSSGQEIESASLLLSKKNQVWKNLPIHEYRQKVSRFLYSRGFTWDVIERVLKRGYNDTNVSSDTDL